MLILICIVLRRVGLQKVRGHDSLPHRRLDDIRRLPLRFELNLVRPAYRGEDE